MTDIITDLLDFKKFTRQKANRKLRRAAAEEIKRLRAKKGSASTGRDVFGASRVKEVKATRDLESWRCKAMTQQGTRCSRKASWKGYCGQHCP
jgi:hypothetical protein